MIEPEMSFADLKDDMDNAVGGAMLAIMVERSEWAAFHEQK